MIIVCRNCKSKFDIAHKFIKAAGFKLKCPNCNYRFIAYRPDPNEKNARDEKQTDMPNRGTSAHIIAVCNQKGGVAKTTTCLNLGFSLSLMKKRVLIVDYDVQSNLTFSLGYRNTNSFYEALRSGLENIPRIVIKTKYPNFWLLPSNKNMVLLNKNYFGTTNYEYLLRDGLSFIKDKFDYILIDNPPSIEFLTINAMTASNSVIIPVQCEYLSAHGADQVVKMVKLIRKKTNPRLEFNILITMFDDKSNVSKMIYSKLKALYQQRIYHSHIPIDYKIKESQVMSMPVMHYDKKSKSGMQYVYLAKEIAGRR